MQNDVLFRLVFFEFNLKINNIIFKKYFDTTDCIIGETNLKYF